MNYIHRKAYIEMIKKENRKSNINEDTPLGAMGSGSYMKASMETPSSRDAIYVAFKGNKCKTFDSHILRRKFLDENTDWQISDNIKEDTELTLEENLFWEEVGALYLNEDGVELSEEEIDNFLEGDIEVGDEEINERIIKTWVKGVSGKILRMVSDRKGYKIIKDKKTGMGHEVKISMGEKNKRKEAAKRAKKYYKKNRKKKLSYMKKHK